MAESRLRREWDQTARLAERLSNVHRGRHQQPFAVSDFHPFEQSQQKQNNGLRALKERLPIRRLKSQPERP